MYKRAQTLGIWWEVIILSLVFVVGFIAIVASFNNSYGTSEDPTFDITSFSNAEQELNDFGGDINNIKDQVGDGEFEFKDSLIIIKTVGNMIKTIVVSLLDFLTGAWIYEIATTLLKLPPSFAIGLRIIFGASIIFILIKLVFRFKG